MPVMTVVPIRAQLAHVVNNLCTGPSLPECAPDSHKQASTQKFLHWHCRLYHAQDVHAAYANLIVSAPWSRDVVMSIYAICEMQICELQIPSQEER